jgi:hypothetical protein
MIKELAILELVGDDLRKVELKMRSMGDGAYAPWPRHFCNCLAVAERLRPAVATAHDLAGRRFLVRIRRRRLPGRRRRDAHNATWCMMI